MRKFFHLFIGMFCIVLAFLGDWDINSYFCMGAGIFNLFVSYAMFQEERSN